MGYTHYWSNSVEFRPEAWKALQETAQKIIDKARASYFITVAAEYDTPNEKPEITDDHIRLNGIGDDGHETFYLSRGATDFEFCKTARKDYDAVVAAILMAAAEYSTGFSWRSDGYGIDARDPSGKTVYNDHGDALKLYNESTGNGLKETNAEINS